MVAYLKIAIIHINQTPEDGQWRPAVAGWEDGPLTEAEAAASIFQWEHHPLSSQAMKIVAVPMSTTASQIKCRRFVNGDFEIQGPIVNVGQEQQGVTDAVLTAWASAQNAVRWD